MPPSKTSMSSSAAKSIEPPVGIGRQFAFVVGGQQRRPEVFAGVAVEAVRARARPQDDRVFEHQRDGVDGCSADQGRHPCRICAEQRHPAVEMVAFSLGACCRREVACEVLEHGWGGLGELDGVASFARQFLRLRIIRSSLRSGVTTDGREVARRRWSHDAGGRSDDAVAVTARVANCVSRIPVRRASSQSFGAGERGDRGRRGGRGARGKRRG